MTLNVQRLTASGEIRTCDLIDSIAKRLHRLCSSEFRGTVSPGRNNTIRTRELRKYAERLAKLAKALEANP